MADRLVMWLVTMLVWKGQKAVTGCVNPHVQDKAVSRRAGSS